jgi:hypothetical protein
VTNIGIRLKNNNRVIRGGSFISEAVHCRSASRFRGIFPSKPMRLVGDIIGKPAAHLYGLLKFYGQSPGLGFRLAKSISTEF